MISTALQRLKYIGADYLSTLVAVLAFEIVRFHLIPEIWSVYGSVISFLGSRGVWLSLGIFPPVLLLLFAVSGYYVSPIHRSRADEFLNTLITTFIGTLIFFFGALLNDIAGGEEYPYEVMLLFFAALFLFVYTGRIIITSHAASMIHSRRWSQPVLIVGDIDKAVELDARLASMKKPMGYNPVGYVVCKKGKNSSAQQPVFHIDDIGRAVSETGATGVIIVMNGSDTVLSMKLLNRLYPLDLPILVTTDHYAAMMSRTRFENIAGEPLINLSGAMVSDFTVAMKRFCDMLFSSVALILTSPVIAALAVAIKLDSPGSAFYSQERMGRYRRPFKIRKLRSMRRDAESGGPALSSDHDTRVTRMGRFMRKYRLDELPNFWNVLCGEMSLVGPRPERAYFIEQITEKAPIYTLLHQIRPGITSWGMVKFGYASTVPQMIERMRYDLVYLSNISVTVDIKILFYTIRTVVTGQGV